MMDGMAVMGIWMLIWGLLGLALIALVVVGLVWLLRSISGSQADAVRGRCLSGLAVQVGKALAHLMVIGIGRSGVGGDLMISRTRFP